MPPSPLSLRALARGQQAVADGVRGGRTGWGKYRGTIVDGYQRFVGLPPPADPMATGVPWCIAAQASNLKDSELPGEVSHCPRTGSTLHCAALAPEYCRLPGPRPGAVGILKHADGIHGHAVMCESVTLTDGTVFTKDNWPADDVLPGPIALVTTCEGDTNRDGSATGDQWGRHTWDPSSGKRGEMLGWWDFGASQKDLTS